MTEERIQPYNEKTFFNNYTMLIDNFILPLRNNELHNNIMAQINKLISKGFKKTSVVRKVLKKHKTEFEDLFKTELSDDEGSDEEESDVNDEELDNEYMVRLFIFIVFLFWTLNSKHGSMGRLFKENIFRSKTPSCICWATKTVQNC